MTRITYRLDTQEQKERMWADVDHWQGLGYRTIPLLGEDARGVWCRITVTYGLGGCPECDSQNIISEIVDDECGPAFIYCYACGAPYHEPAVGGEA